MSRDAEIRHLRVFVHLSAYAVSHEVAHYAVAAFFVIDLYGVGDVPQPSALDEVFHSFEKALACGLHQPALFLAHFADEESPRRVRLPSVQHNARVYAHNHSLFQSFVAGNAVHDHLVDRGAYRSGKAAVSEEGRRAAVPLDVVVCELVEFLGAYAGTDLFFEVQQEVPEHLSRLSHQSDFGGTFEINHSAPSLSSRSPVLSCPSRPRRRGCPYSDNIR